MSTSRYGRRAEGGPIGLFSRAARSEGGFTLVEVGIVVFIIGIMLGAVLISYVGATRRTEVTVVAEQIKQEIRRVYAMADSGEKTNDHRNRYRIIFNNNGETPANCYKVQKGTSPDGVNYSYTDMTPEKAASQKVVSTYWVQPAMGTDCQLMYNNKTITFISKGSLVQTDAVGDCTIAVTSVSQNRTITVRVNTFGSVDSN